MKLIFPAILLLSLLAACGGKNKIPGGILPKEKMEAVLWDILEADQFLSDFVFSKDTTLDKLAESMHLYEQVFHIHNTSREEFSRSFAYYRSHPVLLKEVLDSLNVKQMPQPVLPRPVEDDDSADKLQKPVLKEKISLQ